MTAESPPVPVPGDTAADTAASSPTNVLPIPTVVSDSVRRKRAVAALVELPECKGCSNRAKRFCSNQCCRTCCAFTGVPCDSHGFDGSHLNVWEYRASVLASQSAANVGESRARTAKHAVATAAFLSSLSTDLVDPFVVDPVSLLGSCVTGAVEGTCASGVLVQVMVNGWILHGVLFDDPATVEIAKLPVTISVPSSAHVLSTTATSAMVFEDERTSMSHPRDRAELTIPPQQLHAEQQAEPLMDDLTAISSGVQSEESPRGLKRPASPTTTEPKPKKRQARTVPNGPKGPRSAYIYFQAALRARLLMTPEPQHSLIIAQFDWSRISEAEREPYKKLADADKQRFEREMAQWKLENPELAVQLAAAERYAFISEQPPQAQPNAVGVPASNGEHSSSGTAVSDSAAQF